MDNPTLVVNYDPVSDELQLTRWGKSTVVHYTDHPHVALLLDEKTRLWVGFHIEAVSEFIKPGIISEVERLREQLKNATTPCSDCGQYAGTHLSVCESEEANRE